MAYSPEQFHPGDRVTYLARPNVSPRLIEHGEVTSTNRTFVFVRFDKQAPGTFGVAVEPQKLINVTRPS
jgi:hypothetical protein